MYTYEVSYAAEGTIIETGEHYRMERPCRDVAELLDVVAEKRADGVAELHISTV